MPAYASARDLTALSEEDILNEVRALALAERKAKLHLETIKKERAELTEELSFRKSGTPAGHRIYAYIRVSSDKQTNENQRQEINRYAKQGALIIDEWVEETVSGAKDAEDRLLGELLLRLRAGDQLIVCELSRLSRTAAELHQIAAAAIERKFKIICIRDGLTLGVDNIANMAMLAVLSMTAEMERKFISVRTIEALKRVRAGGKILGRPKGTVSKEKKLDAHKSEIKRLLAAGTSVTAIGRIVGAHRLTVDAYIKHEDNKK